MKVNGCTSSSPSPRNCCQAGATARKVGSGCGFCKAAFLSSLFMALASSTKFISAAPITAKDIVGCRGDSACHLSLQRSNRMGHLRLLDEHSDGDAGVNESNEDNHDDHDHDDHDDHDHDDHDDEERSSADKPWGEVILAAVLINLASLTGLVFLVGSLASKVICGKATSKIPKGLVTNNIIPSFACGALLATTLFLILPEGFFLLISSASGESGHDDHGHRLLEGEDDHDDHEGHDIHSEVAWKFGTAVLVGYVIPALPSFFFSRPETSNGLDGEIIEEVASPVIKKEDSNVLDPPSTNNISDGCDLPCCDGVETPDKIADKTNSFPDKPINYNLATSIIIGDFFHNFTDGIFVGTAFLLCDRDLAIVIAAATVYHELAQEVADFCLLTKHCHLKVWVALLLNFVGGFSVLIGAVVILAVDNISTGTTGIILIVGGGVYLHIAVAECYPHACQWVKTRTDRMWSLLSFAIGAVPIGLVLLNHGHCDG